MATSLGSYDLPDDINYDIIEDGLILGNLTTALSVATLQELKIESILTVASEALPVDITELPGIQCLYIQVDDVAASDLLSHFTSGCDFIEQSLEKKKNVLVHCYFGVSRSATLLAAYLMRKYQINPTEAIERIKKKRRCVGPNEGFLSQLDLFYKLHFSLSDLDSDSNIFRKYKFDMIANIVRVEPHRLRSCIDGYFKDFEVEDRPGGGISCLCVNCGASLFAKKDAVEHDIPNEDGDTKVERCPKGVSMLPQKWLLAKKHLLNKLAGTLNCHRCNREIGNYHWLRGVACECGHMEKVFLINKRTVRM